MTKPHRTSLSRLAILTINDGITSIITVTLSMQRALESTTALNPQKFDTPTSAQTSRDLNVNYPIGYQH